jgi:hypothetical protein
MRKVNPADVRTAMVDDLAALQAFYSRTCAAMAGRPHEMADISFLSETTLLTGFVIFERFQSDLVIAYLNRDFTRYQAAVSAKVATSVRDKFGPWVQGRTAFAPKAHVALAELESIVDADGRNLTFKDTAALQARAAEWLDPHHAAPILALAPADVALVDTAKAIRNYIAHGSASAKGLMNDTLATVDTGPPNDGLGRGVHKVHDVGAFLKAYCDHRRRVEKYLDRLTDSGTVM